MDEPEHWGAEVALRKELVGQRRATVYGLAFQVMGLPQLWP